VKPAVDQQQQIDQLKTQNGTLRRLLEQLVFRIDSEAKRGCPLYAKGHPNNPWVGDYPYQLAAARLHLQTLAHRDST